MRAGVFGMHRRVTKRQPRGVLGRGPISGLVGIAYGRHRPPEVVRVFTVKHSDRRISAGDRHEGEKTGAVHHVHVLRDRHLSYNWIVSPCTCKEPEATDGRLLGCTLGAVACSQLTDLVEIPCPDLGVEGGRGDRPELRTRSHRPGDHRPDG